MTPSRSFQSKHVAEEPPAHVALTPQLPDAGEAASGDRGPRTLLLWEVFSVPTWGLIGERLNYCLPSPGTHLHRPGPTFTAQDRPPQLGTGLHRLGPAFTAQDRPPLSSSMCASCTKTRSCYYASLGLPGCCKLLQFHFQYIISLLVLKKGPLNT